MEDLTDAVLKAPASAKVIQELKEKNLVPDTGYCPRCEEPLPDNYFVIERGVYCSKDCCLGE